MQKLGKHTASIVESFGMDGFFSSCWLPLQGFFLLRFPGHHGVWREEHCAGSPHLGCSAPPLLIMEGSPGVGRDCSSERTGKWLLLCRETMRRQGSLVLLGLFFHSQPGQPGVTALATRPRGWLGLGMKLKCQGWTVTRETSRHSSDNNICLNHFSCPEQLVQLTV